MNNNPIKIIKGHGADLELYSDHVVIKRNGIQSTLFGGDAKILLDYKTSVDFKMPGILSNGHLEFIVNNARNPHNIIHFKSNQASSFEDILDTIYTKIESAKSAMPNYLKPKIPLKTATGNNGQLELYEDKIRIKREGISAFAMQGLKGDKDIYIKQISSIQYKSPGLGVGYIQFSFLGGLETKAGYWDAFTDENTITFHASQEDDFKMIKYLIDQKLNIIDQAVTQPTSSINELEKLADLKNKGVITEEEFNVKKKQILGI